MKEILKIKNAFVYLQTIFIETIKGKTMKKGIHPKNYRLVAFKDISNGHVFITRSTANSKETIEIDGVEYPLIKLEISNTSHGFFTGQKKLIDTAGRVDKFKRRYSKFNLGED